MKTGILLLALIVAPSASADEKSFATRAQAAEATNQEGMVCEMRKEAGSKLAKRVCTTEDQRQAAKEKAQQQVQRIGDCSGNEVACTGDL